VRLRECSWHLWSRTLLMQVGPGIQLSVAERGWMGLQKLLPGRRVEVRTAGGPFEDEAEGLWSQFDAGKKKLTPQKLVLETKRDGLTSIVALGRQVARMDADLVLGEGQGAVIAAGYARPALLEFALQARNVQRE